MSNDQQVRGGVTGELAETGDKGRTETNLEVKHRGQHE